jgi:acyl-CoA dehydrogenase-like protein
MESCLRRAQKASSRAGAESASVMGDATRVFIADAADRAEREARTALAATVEGDMLRTQLAVLRRFAKRDAIDTIALRRRVAAAVLSGDRYPFEAR